MPATPEPINWNEVRALFESQDKKITMIAEGVVDLQKKVDRIERKVDALTGEMADVKGFLNAFNSRLSAVEAKVSL